MFKWTLGLGALLVWGSAGAGSLSSGVAREEAPASGRWERSPDGAEEMISSEERERRVQVCERAFEDCRDWCTRTKGGGDCYAECSKKLAACMKDIPYADD